MDETEVEEDFFQQILEVVRRAKGFDGGSYKPNYLKRRVAIRMRAVGTRTYGDYLKVLRSDSRESQQLLDRLTVHVTEFFRDPEVFQAVEDLIFPSLDEMFGAESWCAWSAGSSTGEEAYSMAIALREWRERHGGGEYRIEGTDVDPASVVTAGRGEYTSEAISKLPLLRQQRFFFKTACHVEVVPEILRRVQFEVRDLTLAWDRETPQYHMVFCRNLLIYLTPAEHQLIYDRFAKVIKPGGYLVLGRTEALLGRGRMNFRCVDTRNRIYRRLE